MNRIVIQTILFLGGILLFNIVNSFPEYGIFGISHVGITVDNLNQATKFYVDVLGGKKIDELSVVNLQGDSHFYRMFQKEILEATEAGETQYTYGIPDIRQGTGPGSCKVSWNFILFQNIMVQLLHFSYKLSDVPFALAQSNKGTGKIGYGHVSFSAKTDVVPLQQIEDLWTKEKSLNYQYSGFISKQPVDTLTTRNSLPVEDFLLSFGDGTTVASTRGTIGQRIELSYRRGIRAGKVFEPFCEDKGVFPALLKPLAKNSFQNELSKKMDGINHVSLTVRDYDEAVRFYINVLGGKQTKRSAKCLAGSVIYNVFFQDDILQAEADGMVPNEEYGIVNISSPEVACIDIGFFLFDNTYFEPYVFHSPPSQRVAGAHFYQNYTSPAYYGTHIVGFMVDDKVDFNQYIQDLENKAKSNGMPQVRANRAVQVDSLDQAVPLNNYSDPMTSEYGTLEGYNYVFLKGPSGEQLALTQFTGKAKEALKNAMLDYGTVSTAFPETNPWTSGGFSEYCQQDLPFILGKNKR